MKTEEEGQMPQKYNLAHLILVGVVVVCLTLLMAVVDAQAQIAFSSYRDGNFEIYVMNVDGKKLQRLTNNDFDDRDPSWSPDGKRIIFVSERFERDDWNREIYVMDANGGNQQRLTKNHHSDVDPAWFNPAFAVAPAGKQFTIWGWLKQVRR